MRVALGSDEAGFLLKEIARVHLEAKGIEIHDFGVASATPSDTDYPDIAHAVARSIAVGEEQLGILICGTGIGMAMTANKVPGVRAAQAHDVYSAERARKSNNAQVLALGARVIGPELAKSVIDAFLGSDFAGGASTRKVDKLNSIDTLYRGSRQVEDQTSEKKAGSE
jgi:ribose 5-phosphate isomerase B